jgi:hypothetical protein
LCLYLGVFFLWFVRRLVGCQNFFLLFLGMFFAF